MTKEEFVKFGLSKWESHRNDLQVLMQMYHRFKTKLETDWDILDGTRKF